MKIDDMNTMDVDTDSEPTESAEPVVARETCHKHSCWDNTSSVDKSSGCVFDRERDPTRGRSSIVGPEQRPGAFKTNGSRQAYTVHIKEYYNKYQEVVAYKDVYGKYLTKCVFGKTRYHGFAECDG